MALIREGDYNRPKLKGEKTKLKTRKIKKVRHWVIVRGDGKTVETRTNQPSKDMAVEDFIKHANTFYAIIYHCAPPTTWDYFYQRGYRCVPMIVEIPTNQGE